MAVHPEQEGAENAALVCSSAHKESEGIVTTNLKLVRNLFVKWSIIYFENAVLKTRVQKGNSPLTVRW